MKKLKINIIFLTLFSTHLVFQISAQTEAGYRLYKFNALVLNPAQAGSNDFSDVSILGSNYWVGIQGAPRTITASGNLKVAENFGLGIAVIKDQIGPIQAKSINFSGAYHLKLNKDWKLSTGLKITAMEQNVLLADLLITEQNDPDMQQNLTTGLAYNAGFGFLLYSKKFYLGGSLPRVTSIKYARMDMSNFIDKKGGYIVYGGANIKARENFEIRPSAISYFGYGGGLNLDLNGVCTVNKIFDFGLSYQLKGSIGTILGLTVKDKFYIGYTYSYPVNKLNTVSTQSHELALRMMLKKRLSSADSPRFFN